MAACGTAHYAYHVGVKTALRCFFADKTYRPLEVLPCSSVLAQTAFCLRTGCAVFESYNSDAFFIEVPACGSNLEAVRAVAFVASAGIYNLYRLCFQYFWYYN